ATVPMTCHLPIRPPATRTVPRTQIISRQPPATRQLPIGQPRVTWHLRQHRSMTVNAVDHLSTVVDRRSTASDHGGQRRSPMAGHRYCRWTIVDHHRTTGQRWLVGSQRLDMGRSGSALGRVWIGSG
nr:hypothetical protein [Tanacetum cinerariifolium]